MLFDFMVARASNLPPPSPKQGPFLILLGRTMQVSQPGVPHQRNCQAGNVFW